VIGDRNKPAADLTTNSSILYY